MKKQILVLASLFAFLFSSVQAEVGVNVGISGNMCLFGAGATETEDGEKSRQKDAMLAVGWMSVFAEKTLGSRLSVGINYVPSALESETKEKATTDMTTSNTNTSVTQKIKVDFEDLTTYYVALNVTDNMYVKAGVTTVDVVTKESLGTGSSYGNTTLDGTTIGFGYNKDMDNGMFLRTEASYVNFDSAKLTSSTGLNTVETTDINGASASISIGKSF